MYGHNFPTMTRHDRMIDIGDGLIHIHINLKEKKNNGFDFQCLGEGVTGQLLLFCVYLD